MLNTDIFNLKKRLDKDNYVIVKDGSLARNFGKKPEIRQLRKNNELFIGYDRGKKVTIIFKKPKF